MRKLREFAAIDDRIQLVKLDDDTIKYVMKASRCLKARLMLVDIYLEKEIPFEMIEPVVLELNDAIADRPTCKFRQWTHINRNDPTIFQPDRS